MFSLNSKDEISDYIKARYVGAIEATWRLLGNNIAYHNPPVQTL